MDPKSDQKINQNLDIILEASGLRFGSILDAKMEPSRHQNGDRTEAKREKPVLHSEYKSPIDFHYFGGSGCHFWSNKPSNIDGKREAKTKTEPRAVLY